MKVLLIGGGIGGLTAAIALKKAALEPHVFERAPALREVGAGIGMMSNAVRALDAVGLGSAVRAESLAGAQGGLRNPKGRALMNVPADEFAREFGSMAVMHRAELLALLAREAIPARLHVNRECVGFEQDDDGVTAHFRDGESVRGDILIGADGLRSVVRERLWGTVAPKYAGYTAWRSAVPFEKCLPPLIAETWGCGARFGIVPMTKGRVYWFATRNAPEGARDPAGRTKDTLLKLFRGWHEPIEALIEASDENAILRNDIYDLDPLPRWGKGRVTLLGDAAHPMTPNLGQGACQAIEDAVVLAVCLRQAADPVAGLAAYEQRRISRAREIVLQSRRFGAIAQSENRWACWLRDLAVRYTPRNLTVRTMKSVVGQEVLTVGERALLTSPAVI